MALLILRGPEIERLLPMAACIEVMAEALAAQARGELHHPLRTVFAPPGADGFLVWMPAHRAGGAAVYAVKQLCIVPKNPGRGLDAHQGTVLLLDGETGQLRAVLDAATVTAIRTAAVSAVATRCLAREDASELAIIGTGAQAARHLEAIPLVRPIRRVRVAGRTVERARAFVERHRDALELVAVDGAGAAVRGADIVVTATSSSEPVLAAAWLAPGAHVNAVGATRPPARELDVDCVAACALFCDRRASLDAEAGEWREGLSSGRLSSEHMLGELGEVLAGQRPGRTSASQLTLFRSLGLAIEDLAAAQFVCTAAERSGVGTRVPF